MNEQLTIITDYLRKKGIHHGLGEDFCSFSMSTPGRISQCDARITVYDTHVAVLVTLPIRLDHMELDPMLRQVMRINCQPMFYMGRFELDEAQGAIRFRAGRISEGEIMGEEKLEEMLNYCRDAIQRFGGQIVSALSLYESPGARYGYGAHYGSRFGSEARRSAYEPPFGWSRFDEEEETDGDAPEDYAGMDDDLFEDDESYMDDEPFVDDESFMDNEPTRKRGLFRNKLLRFIGILDDNNV